jgi:FlaA1/EpsC-like NDP-sugar epimerase
MLNNFFDKISHRYSPRWLVLSIDIYLTTQSFILAHIIINGLEFNFKFMHSLPIIITVSLCCFLLIGSHKGVIRHTGFKDVYTIFFALTLVTILLSVLNFIDLYIVSTSYFEIPFSIIIIHFLVSVIILVFSRFVFKRLFGTIISNFKPTSRVLIYGAGDSGLITYYALNEDKQNLSKVIGFIDDHKGKIGKKINQVQIYNPNQITRSFIIKNKIDEIIVSIQNISPSKLLTLVEKSLSKSIKVKIVPPVKNWIDGDLKVGQIKDVKIEDLLGRETINIENSLLKNEFNQKTILITGAAGSIGSEIARQVASYKYHKLILIDQAESPLYNLQQDFKGVNKAKQFFIVADIRGRQRMSKIFDDHKPDIIFHAAAYKHVPLMEENAYEAVNVNVVGTHIIMDLAIKNDVSKFVVVSTDKAVNPTNVMGATKRIAEMYARCLKNKGKTKFIITRFGNVLGSNGSVIPLFKKQIDFGGPLTVTHKEITRYFMTIPEACQLVLEAGAMGKGGEIYVFDMGESIKIFDLALNMIRLSGLNYPEDIEIKITGLRPGEKIYEELLANDENTQPTYNDKIMIAKVRDIDVVDVLKNVIELCLLSKGCDNQSIVKKIKEIVPEYISKNSEFEKLDAKKTPVLPVVETL